MKKLLIATNLIWLSIVIFQGCTTSNHAGIFVNSNVMVQDYSNTTFTGLPSNLVKQIVKEYKNGGYLSYRPHTRNSPADNESLNDLDARSIWFSLDTIKKFIWNIETTAKNKGLPDLNKIGVRLYYGRYPDNTTWGTYPEMLNVSRNFENLHTAFMIPTYFNPSNNYNVDFDPNYVDGSKKPLNISELFNPVKTNQSPGFYFRQIMVLSPTGNNNMEQNHGDLIPPAPPGVYKGADIMNYADNN